MCRNCVGCFWLEYTEVQYQQMALIQSPSLNNNPKILNNYLIFTVVTVVIVVIVVILVIVVIVLTIVIEVIVVPVSVSGVIS